jgi:hypothetical protein
MKKELVQFRTSKKELLKQIAKEKEISLNALLVSIVNEYLKNDKR